MHCIPYIKKIHSAYQKFTKRNEGELKSKLENIFLEKPTQRLVKSFPMPMI